MVLLAVLPATSPGFGQDAPPEQPEARPTVAGVSISNIEPGFNDGAGNLVRADAFAPINVQIRNRTGSMFPGKLQVISRDRDGETVVHELAGFAIKSGMVEDKQFSFFARNPGMYSPTTDLVVRLLDDKARLVASETVPLEYIRESDHLVLDISPQSIKTVIQTALPHDSGVGVSSAMRLRGKVRTAYLPPERLPQFWHELEAVDVIVCDQPDDMGFSPDSDAVKVLTQWVRQGGLLVLGPGTLQAFGESELGKALPAKPLASRRLPAGKVALAGPGTSSLTLSLPREVGAWELQPNPAGSPLLRLPVEQGGKTVLARRRLGTGSIVQSGVSLRLLLDSTTVEGNAVGGAGTRLKPEIFGLRTTLPPDPQQTGTSMWGLNWPRDQGPADLIVGEADFRASGTVLATLLMLLIVIYGLAATLGSWTVLKRRNLTQHAWLAFAGVAIIGSVGAGMLVQTGRGIRADIKQQSFIDLDGATGLASIRTLHGLKMPYDARADIGLAMVSRDELPPDQAKQAYIRPASDLERSTGDSFAVKRDYTVRYGETSLADVPVRATAKQFESYWSGPINGTISASLTALQNGVLSSGSSITNDTDLDLLDCYLVYASTNSFNRSMRDGSIQVVRVGHLAAHKGITDLAAPLDPQGNVSLDVGKVTLPLAKVSDPWLANSQVDMMVNRRRDAGMQQPTSRVDRALAATMLALLSELPEPERSPLMAIGNNAKMNPYVDLPREGGRWLDMRNILDGRSALIVGRLAGPGPMRLKVNGSALTSDGECIVRVVLPLAVVAPAAE